jgi:hypothetical protein
MVDDLRPRKAIAAQRINCRIKPVNVIQRIAFRKQTLHVLPLGRAGWRECAGALARRVRSASVRVQGQTAMRRRAELNWRRTAMDRLPNAVAKVEVDTGRESVWQGGGGVVSEPIFVPRSGNGTEDDG